MFKETNVIFSRIGLRYVYKIFQSKNHLNFYEELIEFSLHQINEFVIYIIKYGDHINI